MNAPPKMMTLGQVPKYLKERYRMAITRQSVYNWVKKGLRDDTLQTITIKGKPTSIHPTTIVTTEAWVDTFLRRCGIDCRKTVSRVNPTGAAKGTGAGQGQAAVDVGSGGGPAASPPRSYPESESDVSGWQDDD
jgi:hypothetical protein